MDNLETCYRLLGLKPGISHQELKQAYKRLAKQWHPDRFAGDPMQAKVAEEKIKAINVAYKTLQKNLGAASSTAKTSDISTDDISTERTTIKKRSNTAVNHYNQAVDLVQKGQYAEAAEELGRAIRLHPKYAEAYRYRGFIYSLLGYELRAEKDLKQAEMLGVGFNKHQKSASGAETACGDEKTSFSKESAPPESEKSDTVEDEFPESRLAVQIKHEFTFECYSGALNTIAVSPNQKIMTVGYDDGSIQLWNYKLRKHFHTLIGHSGKVTYLAFSDDNQILLSGGGDGKVNLWHLGSGSLIKSITTHRGEVTGLTISYIRKLMITSGTDGAIRVWDLRDNKLLRQILDQKGAVHAIALNKTGEIAVCGSEDGSIQFCHTLRGGIVKWLTAYTAPVRGITFADNDRSFASISGDGDVILWKYPSGNHQVERFQAISKAVSNVVFCQDDRILIGGDESGQLLVWDIENGAQITGVAAHEAKLARVLAVTNDIILSAGLDNTIKQWQIQLVAR